MLDKSSKSVASSPGSKGRAKGKRLQSSSCEETPDHPDDIFPLVLTSATQELFSCRTDEDVTAENPHKLLRKDDIIQDMKTRAAVSDFSPVKQIVLDYPEDELLLVFDRDFTYGNSFYLVLTPEAKGRILKPPEPETPEVLESELSKTPEPKQWFSLGSEREIEAESVKESREKLCYKFSRVRRKFGVPICFADRNVADAKDGFIQCPSYQDPRLFIKQMERDCGTQHVPQLLSSTTQTQWKFQKSMSTQCEPRELSEEEKENILQSESLKNFCNLVTPRVLLALQQNEIMGELSDERGGVGTGAEHSDWTEKVSDGLMLCQAFAHLKYTKGKKVSCIHWHPNIQGVIAASLTEKIQPEEPNNESSTTTAPSPPFILFFKFSHPSDPQLLLECPDDIFAFEFCPSDPNVIVGGCRNGQVVLWDISTYVTHLQGSGGRQMNSGNAGTFDLEEKGESETPIVHHCAVSALQSSHKAPITDVQWLPQTFEVTRMGVPVENKANTSVQVVTCSPDCSIMFWDIRIPKILNQPVSVLKQNVEEMPQVKTVPNPFKHLDRTWKPLFKVSLPKIDTSGEYAPLKFNLEPYTGDGHSGRNAGGGSEVIPDYSQLRVPSAKTAKPLEDVNTKIFIGTEDGEIVYTDWKLEKDDSGRLHSAKPLHCFSIHHRLVNTVQRSPFFKDIFLTTGGWNFAIWKEGVMDGPIMQPHGSDQQCTVGCWSLSRPAVFFIGKEDGNIEVWNLLEKTSGPSQVLTHVTTAKITCLKPCIVSPKPHFLAVSDNLGMVRIFEIPKTLYNPKKHELVNVKKYFEGEVDRLRDFVRTEEAWVKQKKEEDEELKKKPEISKPSDTQENEKEDAKEYEDYLMLEEAVLKAAGLHRKSDPS
ncbi:dynein axonemal intermediate chain 3 [Genypterus blacodes]|uniref:dynein axonemal intermediate chain 3 n=1 Tax=Genypterus blacodes TaxID=154954 RepID=UPI003F75E2E1